MRVGGCAESKIAAAVLHVTEKEPLPEDHPFWTTQNLLLTFHTSAISYAEDITKLFIENYRLYIEGKAVKLILKEGINKRKILTAKTAKDAKILEGFLCALRVFRGSKKEPRCHLP